MERDGERWREREREREREKLSVTSMLTVIKKQAAQRELSPRNRRRTGRDEHVTCVVHSSTKFGGS